MAIIHHFHGIAKHLLHQKLVGCSRHVTHGL
ncbi:MAG: homoserine O-succinyltransferase [Rhodobiaceae bacterium]|nr:homoserine O-succinyltransferase [Rhodobiaceae bacterium]